jgi:hypothetical protein
MDAGGRKDRAHAELQEHRSSIHDQCLVGTRPMVAPHDLKAVNPHAKTEEGAKTPEELLDFIAMKGQDGATPLHHPLSGFRQREDRRCEHRRTIPEKETTDVLKSRLPRKPLKTSPR